MMQQLNLYFKVFGLAVDNNGKPDWDGIEIGLGKAKPGVKYSDIQKFILSVPNWQQQVRELLPFESLKIADDDIRLITPEEYFRNYSKSCF